MKKSAFTLSEALLAMAIIGIVAAIVIPGIRSSLPDKNKLLFKKCIVTLEKNINDMVSDENNYPVIPSGFTIDGKDQDIGLTNNFDYNTGAVIATSDDYKFCKQFTSRLSLLNYTQVATAGHCRFTLKDGSSWYINSSGLKVLAGGRSPAIIYFDVNGTNNLPNCPGNLSGTPTTTIVCTPNPDTFQVQVYNDGSIVYPTTYNAFNQLDFLTNNKYLFSNETVQAD